MPQESVQHKVALENSLERAIKRTTSVRRQINMLRRKFGSREKGKASKVLVATILLFALSACSSIQAMTTTEVGREADLTDKLQLFSTAVSWGTPEDVVPLVEPSYSRKFLRESAQKKRDEKVVEAEVKDVSFEEEARSAKVEFEVRYFKIPSYYVRTRLEEHSWKYDKHDGGWKLHEQRVLSDEGHDEAPLNRRGRLSHR